MQIHLSGSHIVQVYYEDTDFSGFVYHANYLKFFERAREQLIGIRCLKQLYQNGIHFVVAEATIKFKKPAQHGDQLKVTSTCQLSRSPVLLFKQHACDAFDQVICQADVQLVTLNAKHRPTRLPKELLVELASCQDSSTTPMGAIAQRKKTELL